MAIDPTRIPKRPWIGLLIATLPIFGTIFLFVAYGVMFGLGLQGRAATGDEVTLVATEGCEQAWPIVKARVKQMGLDATYSSDPFSIHTTLPADDAVAASVPHTLSAPGELSVSMGDKEIFNTSGIKEASVRLDLFMIPSVLLRLSEPAWENYKTTIRAAEPFSEIQVVVDGQQLAEHIIEKPQQDAAYEFTFEAKNDAERMHKIAAVSVILGHGALPCPVSIEQQP